MQGNITLALQTGVFQLSSLVPVGQKGDFDPKCNPLFITTFALNLFILVMLIDNILRCKEDTWSVFFTISSHTWRSYLKPCFCYQKFNINPIIKNKISKVYESIATVGEIRVYWRADFQRGSSVIKKVFWTFSYLYLWHTMWFHAKKLLKTLKF